MLVLVKLLLGRTMTDVSIGTPAAPAPAACCGSCPTDAVMEEIKGETKLPVHGEGVACDLIAIQAHGMRLRGLKHLKDTVPTPPQRDGQTCPSGAQCAEDSHGLRWCLQKVAWSAALHTPCRAAFQSAVRSPGMSRQCRRGVLL